MKKKICLFIFIAIAAILLLFDGAVKVYGWGKTWMGYDLEMIVQEARLKVGPFRIKPVLLLNNIGYDSNVYYGTATEPIKDYTITAGPGFTIYLPLKKKIIFQVYESPQYVYYFETKRERTWNNYFNGQVHFVFNRLVFSFGRGFSDARERWNTEIDIRPRRKEDSFQGSVLWQPSRKTSFSLSYRRANYDYENIHYEIFNVRDRLNREENYVNFTGLYQLSYRVKFFLDVEYGFFDFLNPSNFRDSKSYTIYGGFEFSPFGIVRGRINLGYKYFNPLDPQRKDYRGIAGNTNVSIKMLKFLDLRASYRRDVQFSLWYNNAYFIENIYGIGTSLYLFKNIRLDYDYSLGRNKYPVADIQGLNQDGGILLKRQDDYKIHSVGIYFRLKKNIGIGAIASKWIRDSNLDWEDDERVFIGLNLTYNF